MGDFRSYVEAHQRRVVKVPSHHEDFQPPAELELASACIETVEEAKDLLEEVVEVVPAAVEVEVEEVDGEDLKDNTRVPALVAKASLSMEPTKNQLKNRKKKARKQSVAIKNQRALALIQQPTVVKGS